MAEVQVLTAKKGLRQELLTMPCGQDDSGKGLSERHTHRNAEVQDAVE